MNGFTAVQLKSCGYCGGSHSGTCPRVKSISYHQNGTVAKVEFHDPNAVLRDPEGWPLIAPKGTPDAARRLRCRFGFHRWAYMGEAVARSTPHIAYEVNQVCVGCRVLRFNPDAPGRPASRLGDWRRKPKPDGGRIHA